MEFGVLGKDLPELDVVFMFLPLLRKTYWGQIEAGAIMVL